MGDHWLQRVRAYADKAGKKTVVKEQAGVNSVCGVGGSSNTVRGQGESHSSHRHCRIGKSFI
eukprot:5723897-Prorocentrum_lima.AAC.1